MFSLSLRHRALAVACAAVVPSFNVSATPLPNAEATRPPAITIVAQAHGGHGHSATPVAEYKLGALLIKAPWARATPGGAKVGGGFMTITNTGKEADRLVGGSTEIAGNFEVHEMKMEGNVMKMRALEKGLEIKPGETVELKPGGFHVMFLDLKKPLTEGQPIKGHLVFEKAGTIEIEYRVAPRGAHAQH